MNAPRTHLIVIALALAFVSVLPPLCETARADQEWRVMLRQSREELAGVNEVLRSAEIKIPARLARLDARLDELAVRLNQALLLKVLATVDDNPWILSFVRKRVALLTESLDESLRPLNRGGHELEAMRIKIEQAKVQFGALMAQSDEPDMQAEIGSFLTDLDATGAKVAKFTGLLTPLAAKADGLRQRLGDSRAALIRTLPVVWHGFFTMDIPSLFSPDLWAAIGQDMTTWRKTKRTDFTGVRDILDNFDMPLAAILTAMIGVASIFALRRVGRQIFASENASAYSNRFRRGASLFGVGLAGVSLSLSDTTFVLDILSGRAGEALCSAGLILMIGAVLASRGAAAGEQSARPLWTLWALSCVVQSHGVLQLPLSVLSPETALILTACCLAAWRMSRSLPRGFDKGAAAIFCAAFVLALAATVVGRPGLAVLFGLLSTLTAISVYLALALAVLIRPWRNDPKASIASQGLTALFGFPVLLAGTALTVFWMFTAHSGAWAALSRVLLHVFDVEGLHVSPGGVLAILAGFYLTRALYVCLGALIRSLPEKRGEIDRGMAESLRTIVKYALWGVYVIACLYLLGFSLTSLAVVAGGLSVGVGFGLQNIVNNFISGLILLFGRSILAGDMLQLGEIRGVVRKVNIRNTVVQTLDNATIFIPNSELISGRIINWTHRDKRVRIAVPVGVAYGSDVDLVTGLLIKAAGQSRFALVEPAPDVLFSNFGASSLDFTLRVWVDKSANTDPAASEIRLAIDRLFREAGVEIAYPQTELHIKTAPALERLEQLKTTK